MPWPFPPFDGIIEAGESSATVEYDVTVNRTIEDAKSDSPDKLYQFVDQACILFIGNCSPKVDGKQVFRDCSENEPCWCPLGVSKNHLETLIKTDKPYYFATAKIHPWEYPGAGHPHFVPAPDRAKILVPPIDEGMQFSTKMHWSLQVAAAACKGFPDKLQLRPGGIEGGLAVIKSLTNRFVWLSIFIPLTHPDSVSRFRQGDIDEGEIGFTTWIYGRVEDAVFEHGRIFIAIVDLEWGNQIGLPFTTSSLGNSRFVVDLVKEGAGLWPASFGHPGAFACKTMTAARSALTAEVGTVATPVVSSHLLVSLEMPVGAHARKLEEKYAGPVALSRKANRNRHAQKLFAHRAKRAAGA
eukprot:CAMPEP_0181319852 /NCGR_PEP_ID=MMETSP1101-20121128/17799_1 /TAXON_ID=46948 /ORGANISM="Rhodomonas abbreviata, Strain Caron Lab Isolate" /LENGTH=354 /DNA_ID=CAMNT_0023427493 /DNA_START=50 /DNA_END=1110 /DNA_ORIENTATION=+